MKVLISYMSTDISKLRSFWYLNESASGDRIGSAIEKPDKVGGLLEIFDFSSRQILVRKEFQKPQALCQHNDTFLVSVSSNYILSLEMDNLEIQDRYRSNLFNSIHSIAPFLEGEQSDRFLISSTGIDSLVEWTLNGSESHVWWSAQNSKNYSEFPDGLKRTLDLVYTDHSHSTYPTLQQTTHINSAVSIGERKVLATLFHQGELITITDGVAEPSVLRSELSAPHGAQVYTNNKQLFAAVSDTKANRVIIDIPLVSGLEQQNRILEDDFSWVQNAKICIEQNLIFVLDSNNHRICRYSYEDLKYIDEYKYSEKYRVFDLLVIS